MNIGVDVSLSILVSWGCMPSSGSDGKATQVQSLGQEGLLKKEMAAHSSTLAWKIPWMEKPGRLQSMGSQRVGHD